MNQLKETYTKTMQTWLKETNEKIEFLETDYREDEANLERIKSNVYKIFLQMFELSGKQTNNFDDFKSMYLGFHKKIPTNWIANQKEAEDKDDINYYIETIKLEVAERIEKLFLSLCDRYE